MRGRPKAFDREQALDAALHVFWQQGYGATAIGDLTEAMGIGRQSLYDTYGDKHALYLEALRRYTEMRLDAMRQTFEQPGSPVAHLRTFFAMWKEEAMSCNSGCMMVNSSTEVGHVDDAVARLIEKKMHRLEGLLQELLERARQAGELNDAVSPRALARLILGAAHGLAARAHLGLDEEEIDDVLGSLLALIEQPAAAVT
ncbi:MAG: TetR/AcrR family transcriptional regulator [Acidobacteriota bacterium]